MLKRKNLLSEVKKALERSRVVALLGPRQCGKTTLARELTDVDSPNYFDLEDPVSLSRLDEPMTALRSLKGLVLLKRYCGKQILMRHTSGAHMAGQRLILL